MRTVLQRVTRARVVVREEDGNEIETGAIERGFVLLIGIERGDSEAEVDVTVQKIAKLRVFPGRTPMDETLEQVGGKILAISQFTLGGSVVKGNRPSFNGAEDPELAEPLFEHAVAGFRALGLEVHTGRFGASMHVEIENDGPITFVIAAQDGRVVDP